MKSTDSIVCQGCGCKDEGRHVNRDCPENHKRAIIAPAWYAIVQVFGDAPKTANFVTHEDESGDVRLFRTRGEAFDYAAEFVNEPWKIVEL